MTSSYSPSVVLKFGGTSVASAERWATIREIVRRRLERGYTPLVVCSALSGVTDLLEQTVEAAVRGEHEPVLREIEARHRTLSQALGVEEAETWQPAFENLERLALGVSLLQDTNPSIQARMLAHGELMSSRLGAAYLETCDLPAEWLDAREMLQAAPNPPVSEARRYLSADCRHASDPSLQETLLSGAPHVLVTQGFIARNEEGKTVLIGRGGSDTSAAYFAAKLQAERLEIWTDVPGLFTANPRDLPAARLLRRLGYDEAQELATMGAKVLHPRCIAPVRRYGIPLHIRSVLASSQKGTVVSNESDSRKAQLKALSVKHGVLLISMRTIGMWQQVGFLADVFAVFKRHGLSIDLVATSETEVTVSLDAQANVLAPERIEALLEDLQAHCEAEAIGPSAVVSLIGRNIRGLLPQLGPALKVFEKQHVYLLSQAASDLNFSFVVDEEQAVPLARALHAQFFEDRPDEETFGPSWHELQEEVRL